MAIGADGSAERARRELRAAGEKVRRRRADEHPATPSDLPRVLPSARAH